MIWDKKVGVDYCFGSVFHLHDFTRRSNIFVFAVRSNVDNIDYLKYRTMITVDVHSRDIIENFIRQNVLDEKSFNWECQLRFYWMKEFDEMYIYHWSGEYASFLCMCICCMQKPLHFVNIIY